MCVKDLIAGAANIEETYNFYVKAKLMRQRETSL